MEMWWSTVIQLPGFSRPEGCERRLVLGRRRDVGAEHVDQDLPAAIALLPDLRVLALDLLPLPKRNGAGEQRSSTRAATRFAMLVFVVRSPEPEQIGFGTAREVFETDDHHTERRRDGELGGIDRQGY